ncbi:MAG: protein kinase, partial [Planctomycetota bacterium]|nr:protein kinase [Planctomycetota bacterium]
MFDLMKNDVELAKEALKKGLISEQQLEEALKIKEKEGSVRSVITIMIDKGVISNKVVKEIITNLKGKTVSEEDESYEDIEFGEEAAKKGYITYTQLWDAIENRLKTNQRIEQLLHKGGTLSLDDALDVLESQGKKIMKCPECQAQYTVKDFREGQEYTCLKCGAPLQLPDKIETLSTEGTAYDTKTHIKKIDDMFIGKRVGSCQIMEKLGEGGMGVVFKAKHVTLNKDVAVKILSPALMGEMHKKRFLREARAAAKIEHPNIVTVYDAGEFEGGYSYIVMQFIDGESLSKKIEREQRIDQLSAVRMIKDAAKALMTAHKQGMIHRDIKPDNIMLTKAGEVKVADFGLVKSADVEKDLSLSKSLLMGTPHYMAPEQFEGKPADARVDIYALGVTFFEIVTGKKPFDGKTAFKIMEAHLRQEPPKPETLSKEIHPEVSRVILKMLQKEPEKRYQTAEELIKDLERVEGILTGVRPAGEKRFPVALSIAAVLVVVAAVVGYFIYDGYKRKKEEEAQKEALIRSAQDELNKLLPIVDSFVEKRQFDVALERLDSYPSQYQMTPSYTVLQSRRSEIIKKFKEYAGAGIAVLAADTTEKPEETVQLAEPLLQMVRGVFRLAKDDETERLKESIEGIYKTAEDTVKSAKDGYASIERQLDEMRKGGDFERGKEILLPFTASKVTSVREAARKQVEKFEEMIANARRDFESALTRAEVKEGKGDYEAAIKELEIYKESKITSIRTKANEELGRLRTLKAAKEDEQKLRDSFERQIKEIDSLLEQGKSEEAADMCKKLTTIPLSDLALKAKEKLLFVKER